MNGEGAFILYYLLGSTFHVGAILAYHEYKYKKNPDTNNDCASAVFIMFTLWPFIWAMLVACAILIIPICIFYLITRGLIHGVMFLVSRITEKEKTNESV